MRPFSQRVAYGLIALCGATGAALVAHDLREAERLPIVRAEQGQYDSDRYEDVMLIRSDGQRLQVGYRHGQGLAGMLQTWSWWGLEKTIIDVPVPAWSIPEVTIADLNGDGYSDVTIECRDLRRETLELLDTLEHRGNKHTVYRTRPYLQFLNENGAFSVADRHYQAVPTQKI